MKKMRGGDRQYIRVCQRCGKTYDVEKYLMENHFTQDMLRKRICFVCSYDDWVKNYLKNLKGCEIVNGKVVAYENIPVIYTLKNKQKAYLLKPDGTTKEVYAFWNPVTIPPELAKKYPDTAKQISYAAYHRISAHPFFRCRAKGCYDRYHCYWYDAPRLEADGPWNVVPSYHEVGGEGCESFVDKDAMFNFKTNEI